MKGSWQPALYNEWAKALITQPSDITFFLTCYIAGTQTLLKCWAKVLGKLYENDL